MRTAKIVDIDIYDNWATYWTSRGAPGYVMAVRITTYAAIDEPVELTELGVTEHVKTSRRLMGVPVVEFTAGEWCELRGLTKKRDADMEGIA